MGQPEKTGPTPEQLGGRAGSGAGESENPYRLLGEGVNRLHRYATAKSMTMAAMDAIGDPAAIQAGVRVGKVRACSDWLVFRHFPTLDQTKLRSANFCCTHLICGMCAIRRGARMMARYIDRFQSIRTQLPMLQPYLVTFTVRNGPDLRERLLHLERSLTRLHKRRSGKRSQSLLTRIRGAVWSYEVTHSHQNGWHPHVHAIWLATEMPDMHALRDEWHDVTGDSFMVDVRPIEADPKAPADMDPHAKGFAEVFKYALKAAELPPAHLLTAFQVLKKRRLVRSFGAFYGVKEPAENDLADELPADTELPYIDLIWRFRGDRYVHDRSVHHPHAERGGNNDAGVPSGRETLAAGGLHRPTG